MKVSLSALAGLSLVALAGCHKGKAPEQPRPAPSLLAEMRVVDDDAFLLSDNSPVFTDSLQKVIRDTLEWKEFWDRAVSRRPANARPARPAVDFSKESVALAAAGRLKPGDVVHVDSVGTRKDLTVIVVRYTIGCQDTRQTAYPFEMARIPKVSGEVTWREHRYKAPECQ
ncbi:MAG TPA: hypothetical protein VG692_17735 [Gemmatimonadales bacterium]|nr:hypothetical protein [Gemmatimonadales bacterium]